MSKATPRQNNKAKRMIYTLGGIAFVLITVFAIIAYTVLGLGKKPATSEGWENRYFTLEDLKKYNDTDPKKPIYMGYEGMVYDVSAGAGFYSAGKTYNYLTGRDATAELNEVGVGEIIVRKYPVVGIIKN